MRGTKVIDADRKQVAEWKEETVGQDVIISAHGAGKFRFRRPGRPAVGGSSVEGIPKRMVLRVHFSRVHPRDADVSRAIQRRWPGSSAPLPTGLLRGQPSLTSFALRSWKKRSKCAPVRRGPSRSSTRHRWFRHRRKPAPSGSQKASRTDLGRQPGAALETSISNVVLQFRPPSPDRLTNTSTGRVRRSVRG
jgi:hypothetical protein